jgi:hypothetical protein
LCERGTIDDLPRMSWPSLEKRVRVSPLTLQHEMEVQDVRATLHSATSEVEGLSIEQFSTWPRLYEFDAFNPEGAAVTVKPDGFIRLHHRAENGETVAHFFFLELDRSTEPQETLANRAHCYRDFYQRGGLAVRHGRPVEEFARYPFRVLMVFKNPERRNNSAERLLLARPPILTQVWLTTFDEVTADPLAAIWVRPIDYRNCVQGTAYENAQDSGAYRRQTGRETMVETNIAKRRLFGPTS